MKQVDTKAYMTALRSLTEQGHSVSVPVSGSSMSPFLAGGRDTVFFSRPDTPLRRGDIVFYERASGQFVMHRVRRVHRDGSLDILGDAQAETGPWLWVIPLRHPIVRIWSVFKKRRT